MMFLRKLIKYLRSSGLSMLKNYIVNPFKNIRQNKKNKKLYEKQLLIFAQDSKFPMITKYPILNQKNKPPKFDAHYFYHPAWAARVLHETKPKKHVDISSKLSFAGYMSAFIPVEYCEFTKPDVQLDNLTVKKVDISKLPFENCTIESLSCMHVVEHIGLGRYGDNIDVDGDIKACKELIRVLLHGGHLLFVVPISHNPRIEFNAHRVYAYDMVLEIFQELKLKEFAIIPDDSKKGLIRNANYEQFKNQRYACGCFHFQK